jgi:hypothetical protein
MELRDGNHQVPDTNGPPASVTALIQNITSNISVFGYNDEYEPSRPNDYEKLKEQRKREQHQRDRDVERQRRDEHGHRGLYDDADEDDERDDGPGSSRREANERATRKGNVFAPPPSLIEEDKRASGNNSMDAGKLTMRE